MGGESNRLIMGFSRSVQKAFVSIDMFGNGVNLNLAGQEKVKSLFGAILSFFVLMTVLAYSSERFEVLIHHKDNHNTLVHEPLSDPPEFFEQTDSNFDLAF